MTQLFEKAIQLEKEAASFGFCWENTQQIMAQIASECTEIQEHLHPAMTQAPYTSPLLQEEIGDLFHAILSLCAFCHIDPTATLHLAITKFEKRLRRVQLLAHQQGLTNLQGYPFEVLMTYWNQAKEATASEAIHTALSAESATTDFSLDNRLQNSCLFVIDWPISRVLLKNNCHFPWFILVPRRQAIQEIFELSPADSQQFQKESHLLARLIQQFFQADKINIASLGNIVSQYHLHIIARFKKDILWPYGLWHADTPEAPYTQPIPWLSAFTQTLKNSF